MKLRENKIPLVVKLTDKKFVYDYSLQTISFIIKLIIFIAFIIGLVFISLDKNIFP